MKTNIKAVIFDLDGTLLNTLDDLADSCNIMLKKFNFPQRTIDEVRQFVGNGLGVLVEKAIPDGKKNPLYEQALDCIRKTYATHSQVKTKPYDGIIKLIQDLNKNGIHTGIVSNKPDAQVKELAERYFASYISSNTAVGEQESKGIRRKPAPDSILSVMSILKVQPEQAVYAGDSDVDIATARNAGIPCISVTWGFRSKEFLLKNGAQILADKPQDLPSIIEGGCQRNILPF
ncbi:MAG: HAD hydrolase-like protein [Treponema sp.]|nr:HAD hydrolase-like protein [Treponema sp.]